MVLASVARGGGSVRPHYQRTLRRRVDPPSGQDCAKRRDRCAAIEGTSNEAAHVRDGERDPRQIAFSRHIRDRPRKNRGGGAVPSFHWPPFNFVPFAVSGAEHTEHAVERT